MKHSLKKLVFYITALLISPLILVFKISLIFSKDAAIFTSMSQLVSLIPGKTGNYIRASFYYFCMYDFKWDIAVSFSTLFSHQKTTINHGVYIGPQCNIGLCFIGKNTLIGSGVHIMSGKGQHNFLDLNTPIKEQGGVFVKIKIGNDCWIGNGSLIMANIGEKSIIGAGSVITKDIPPFSIVAGNPAKIIKSRVTE